MSAAERVSNGWNRLLGRIRHPQASEVTEGTTQGLGHIEGHKYCLLVTFRRNGDPVPTPVWFGLDNDSLYARSEERVGKVKRIRANPRVLVAPCDSRGKPLGPAAERHARIVPPRRRRRPSARSRPTSASAERSTKVSRSRSAPRVSMWR